MSRMRVDLVLLDIHMPVLDGPETFAKMRQSDRLRDIPVIALTADAMGGEAEKYLAMGMNGYVPKPVAKDNLIAVVTRSIMECAKSADELKAVKKAATA